MLVTSIFSFSSNVFYLLKDKFSLKIKYLICRCKSLVECNTILHCIGTQNSIALTDRNAFNFKNDKSSPSSIGLKFFYMSGWRLFRAYTCSIIKRKKKVWKILGMKKKNKKVGNKSFKMAYH